jgi:hypothetical protein
MADDRGGLGGAREPSAGKELPQHPLVDEFDLDVRIGAQASATASTIGTDDTCQNCTRNTCKTCGEDTCASCGTCETRCFKPGCPL